MNVRKAIKVLFKFRNIEDEMEATEKEYKKIYDRIDRLASIPSPVQKMTGLPGSGGTAHTTEDYAIRRIQAGEKYQGELQRLNDKMVDLVRFKAKVEDTLQMCTAIEEEIITRRWIQKETMIDIAKDMAIGRTTAYRYQWKAFAKIEEAFISEDVYALVDESEIDETEREMQMIDINPNSQEERLLEQEFSRLVLCGNCVNWREGLSKNDGFCIRFRADMTASDGCTKGVKK